MLGRPTPGGARAPTTTLAKLAIARGSSGGSGRRAHRGPRRWGGGGVERHGRGGGLSLHGELLEEKLVADVAEGGKRHCPLVEILQVVVARLRPRRMFNTRVRSRMGSPKSRRESTIPLYVDNTR